jgi:hypothetical protein
MKSIMLTLVLFIFLLPAYATIHKVGDYVTPGSARHVVLHDNLAFVIGNHTGLQMVDVTNPLLPVAGGVSMDLGHNLNSIIVEGNEIYAVGDSIGLIIIGHPAANTIVTEGSYTADYNSQSIDVENHVAYIVSQYGLDMYDVTNPAAVTYYGNYNNTSRTESFVSVIGNTAYVMDLFGFQILNVTNPEEPVIVSSYQTTEMTHHLAVVNNIVYLVLTSGLQMVSVTDPQNPELIGFYAIPFFPSDSANSVSIVGTTAYINCATGMQIVNVSDPQNPINLGSYQSLPLSNINSVVLGNYAYVALGDLGMQILDVSVPQNQQFLSNYNDAGVAHSIYSAGNTAYIAYGNLGLQLVDVTDAQNPIFLGSYGVGNNAYFVTVSGSTAYLLMNGDTGNGLWMIDVSNPQSPTFLGRYSTPNAKYVTVVNGRAYVLDTDLGMAIINVADPLHPHYLGSYNTPGNSLSMVVLGNIAYIATEWSGLRIVDVTNPSNPQQLGLTDSFLEAHSIAVYENTAYVADFYAGLKIFDVTNPAAPILTSTLLPHPTSRINEVYVKYGLLFISDNSWNDIEIFNLDNPLEPTLSVDYPWNHISEGTFFANQKLYSANGLYGMFIQDFGFVVPVDDEVLPPTSKLSLSNYPNPFNPSTTISFNLPAPGLVKLNVYNIKGQLVKTLANEQYAQGNHTLTWNGTDNNSTSIASGVYFARITNGGKEITKKLVLVK